MQQQKLYKWLLPLVALGALASCSRNNYPSPGPYPPNDGVYYSNPGQIKKRPPQGYRPPSVIIIADNLCHTDARGQRYYDNDYGYRYWRNQDGKYYLNNAYDRDTRKGQRKWRKYNRYDRHGY